MAVDIRFILDGSDRGQPLNAEDFGFTINEVVEINARIVSFDNELIFGGDVFSYMYGRLDTNGFCNLINVEVQYLCDGIWARLVNGYIVLSECIFDLDKCQVKTKLYDESFSTKINNNKGIPFSLSNGRSKNGLQVNIPRAFRGTLFKPVNSSFPFYQHPNVGGTTLTEAFTYLVSCMSDNLIDFRSDFFDNGIPSTAPYFYKLFITNGSAVAHQSSEETVVSFEALYIALKKKFNLGIEFQRQPNGRPLLRMELESYFYQSNPSVTLYDQPGIDLQFDKARLYQAVEFGSEPMLEKEFCNGGSNPCTFIQTPFRGFRQETFGFTGECNTSNILQLSSSEVIFDTNAIEDCVTYASEEYKRNPIIVEGMFDMVGGTFFAMWFDPYSIGQSVFNGDLRNINVSANWISGYPNSLYSFLTAPFDPATTIMSSNISNDAQIYPIGNNSGQFNQWFRYSTYAGNWLKFLTETDPYNLFDGETYTCPYLGTYTINSRVCFGYLEPIQVADRGRQYETIITHLNGAGVVIEEFFHSPAGDSGNLDQYMTFDKTFICNQGDLIRIDARVKYAAALSYPPSQRFLDNFTAPAGTFYSYFNVSGTPLNPNNPAEELQPVNIEDVRAYLYKFERPLSMTEINSILDNTSKPIRFGIENDALRTIKGYIKTLNVNSILRKSASIELKSNKLLR